MAAYENSERRTIRVWTYRPETWTDADPVLFVMHGMGRNAETYLDAWTEIAEQHGFLLVAPEFESRFAQYVTSDYQEGNVQTFYGALNPEEEWAFTVIENIFDRLNTTNGWSALAYDMFGHSAGGQFVQRMVMLKPHARIRRAVAANAGTYTFPDETIGYPFGLRSVPHDLTRSYTTDLIILLGELDNTADQGRLDQSGPAMAQGEHRLERGRNFFSDSQKDAEGRRAPFHWRLRTVPDTGHDFRAMSEAAAALF
ncbi:hypothetical protein [Brevundimonas sp.]|uniref:hypothetical protein n=1 Tax=Brevundimonas sp. TaxID=1871086 RepID=UPI0025C50B17|nr:hypothetical protein [Brevundimonas sp.]